MQALIAMTLVLLSTGSQLKVDDPKWKIAERIDVAQVPSWFPVGFSLLTHGDRQYVAYYDTKHRMTIASRALSERKWQRQTLDSKVGWDSHNGITMALDSSGHLHISGNMHCVPLIYFRTKKPGDITTLKRMPMTGNDEGRCTYPRFLNDANDRLIFHYRDGGSGNGRRLYNAYDSESKTWSRLFKTPLFDGRGKRNAYPLGPDTGPDGRFHVIWVWRDTPDCATNSNLSYARSRDLVHWETAAGRSATLPITLDTKGMIIDPAPAGSGMINGGQRLAFDSQKRPMVAYHKRDGDGHMQIYIARFEGDDWNRQVLSHWNKPVPFSGRGAMPFIGIRVSRPQLVDGKTWIVSYRHRDFGSGTLSFDEETLLPLTSKPPKLQREFPAELSRPEIDFENIGIRRANDLGDSGDPDVRYTMKWDVLPPHHDRERKGPLPPPAMLRVYKLVRE